MALGFPYATTQDGFAGTDGDDLSVYSSNWAAIFGGISEMEILSSTATGIVTGNNANYWTPQQFGPDLDAYILIATKPADARTATLSVRAPDPSVSTGFDGYAVRAGMVAGAANDTIQIRRWDNASSTLLGSGFTQEITAGDAIGIRCIGDQISAYYYNGSWNLLGTETDATYSAAGYSHLLLNDVAATGQLDAFGSGTLGSLALSADGSSTATGAGAALAKAEVNASGAAIATAAGSAKASAALSADGAGIATGAGAAKASAALSADGVSTATVEGTFTLAAAGSGDMSSAGTSTATAVGAALASAAMSADGASTAIAEGVGGAPAPTPEPEPTVPGDGGAIGRNAWREQRERDEREIELELAELTAIARLAAQQLARDHMARQARR